VRDPGRSGFRILEDLPGGTRRPLQGFRHPDVVLYPAWLPGAVRGRIRAAVAAWVILGSPVRSDLRCVDPGCGIPAVPAPDPGKISLEAPGGRYRASGIRTWFYTPGLASRGGAGRIRAAVAAWVILGSPVRSDLRCVDPGCGIPAVPASGSGKISLEAPGGRYRASGIRTWFYTPAMASRGSARPDPRRSGAHSGHNYFFPLKTPPGFDRPLTSARL